RVLLQSRVMREYGAIALLVREKDARESRSELIRHLIDRHEIAGTSRALDAEVLTEIVMELLQRFDDEEVDGEPDRSAPVRVATEEATVGLRGLVAHREIHVVVPIDVRVLFVHTRERAHAVGRKKLRLVEQALEEPLHAMAAKQ